MLLPVIRPLLPAVLLAAALALAGCSSTSTPAATSAAPVTQETSVAPTPTPTAEPDAAWGVTCTDSDSLDDVSFTTYQAAWTAQRDGAKFDDCDGVELTTGPESTTATAAIKAAKYDPADLHYLYGMCGLLHDSYYTMSSYSESQVEELTGMLILCPDHPKAKTIAAKFGKSKKIAEELANGERFYAGTFRVGKQIKAGTYVVKSDDLNGCYWERLNKAGDIIDNNFMSGGTRAEVTIAASDYSFVNRECGQWVLQQ